MNNIFNIASPLGQKNTSSLNMDVIVSGSSTDNTYCAGVIFIILILAMISAWYLKVQRFKFTPVLDDKCKMPREKKVSIRTSPLADGRFVVWDFYAPYNNNVFPLLLRNKEPSCIDHSSYNNYTLADGTKVWGYIVHFPITIKGNSFYLSKLMLRLEHVDLHVSEGGISEVSHNPLDVVVTVHVSPYPFLNHELLKMWRS